MVAKNLLAGTVHNKLPGDLRAALIKNEPASNTWEAITPLARNEWICWVESAKLNETRKRRIKRATTELTEGTKRPCCWIGCIHRTDKEISPSVKWVLSKKSKKSTQR